MTFLKEISANLDKEKIKIKYIKQYLIQNILVINIITYLELL